MDELHERPLPLMLHLLQDQLVHGLDRKFLVETDASIREWRRLLNADCGGGCRAANTIAWRNIWFMIIGEAALRSSLDRRVRVTPHLGTKLGPIPPEVLVLERGPEAGHPAPHGAEAPPIELPDEASEDDDAIVKVIGKDMRQEPNGIMNGEAFAVGQPADDGGVVGVREDGKEDSGKRLGCARVVRGLRRQLCWRIIRGGVCVTAVEFSGWCGCCLMREGVNGSGEKAQATWGGSFTAGFDTGDSFLNWKAHCFEV